MHHPVSPLSASTTDCILLNRSNYRKENNPELAHPTRSSEALSGASALFLSPAGVSYMQVSSGNSKAPLNRAANVVHFFLFCFLLLQKALRKLAHITAAVHASFKLQVVP